MRPSTPSSRPTDTLIGGSSRSRRSGRRPSARAGTSRGSSGSRTRSARPCSELALPSAGKSQDLSPGPMPDWVLTSGRPGPTIMVIGDSFTASYFPPMLAAACRARDLAQSSRMRLRLELDRQAQAGRGLVDADGALPDLRRGRPAAQLRRSGRRIAAWSASAGRRRIKPVGRGRPRGSM